MIGSKAGSGVDRQFGERKGTAGAYNCSDPPKTYANGARKLEFHATKMPSRSVDLTGNP